MSAAQCDRGCAFASDGRFSTRYGPQLRGLPIAVALCEEEDVSFWILALRGGW